MTVVEFLLVALATMFLAATVASKVRLRRRRGLSRDQFAEAFRAYGVPYKLAAAVYDYYAPLGGRRGYLVSPGDTYEGVLHESAEDIDDAAQTLLAQLRLRAPMRQEWPSSFTTVGDMVLWLNSVRQRQPDESY